MRYEDLIVELDPAQIERFRTGHLPVAAAEVALRALLAALTDVGLRLTGRDAERARWFRQTGGSRPIEPRTLIAEPVPVGAPIMAPSIAPIVAPMGSPSEPAPRRVDPASVPSAPLGAEGSLFDSISESSMAEAEHALLRPPTVPPQPVELRVEPRSPVAKRSTQRAMDALFDDDEASAGGLMLFGDDAPPGFVAPPGTDPDMAPVPDDSLRPLLGRPETPAAGPAASLGGEARLAGAAAAHSAPDAELDELPTLGAPLGDVAADEVRLAGAEPAGGELDELPTLAPSFGGPLVDPDDDFVGFGWGDDEPTLARPAPDLMPDRLPEPLGSIDRSSAAERSGEKPGVVDSVRKLFGR